MVISNTPGTVYGDLIIMPLRVSEGTDAPFGHIQAFNIKTGKLAWVFHTIPMPGEYGYDTWPKNVYKNTDVGAGNNWSGMAVSTVLLPLIILKLNLAKLRGCEATKLMCGYSFTSVYLRKPQGPEVSVMSLTWRVTSLI